MRKVISLENCLKANLLNVLTKLLKRLNRGIQIFLSDSFFASKNPCLRIKLFISYRICELNWPKAIGIDFIQEEDLYGGVEKYDAIVEKVMINYLLLGSGNAIMLEKQTTTYQLISKRLF